MPEDIPMEAEYGASSDAAVAEPPPEADPSSTVPTEDQFSTATAPVTRDELFYRTPKLTDEEADVEIDRLPYYNADQRKEAQRRLSTYLEDQHHKLDSQRMEERERQLLDPDNEERAKFYASPEVKEAAYLNKDPNKMWAKHVVTKVLEEDIIKRPLLDGEYEGAKNRWIGGMAGVPKMGDTEALSFLTKRAEVGKEARESLDFLHGTVTKGMIEAVQSKKPYLPGDAWDAARKKYPASAKGNEDELYAQAMRAYEDAQNMVGDNAPALLTGLTYIRKWQAGKTTPQDDQAFMDAMISIPPEDLNNTLLTLTGMVKTEIADPGVVKNVVNTLFNEAAKGLGAKGLGKGLRFSADFAQLQGMQNQINEDKARVDAKGNIVWYPDSPETMPMLNDEQKAAGLAQIKRGFGAIRIGTAVQMIMEPGLAPHIFKKGTPAYVERSLFGAAENLAPMLLAGGKKNVLGYGLYMATVAPSSFQRTMFENPEMDSRVAVGMALIEGNVNYIGDRLEFKVFGGAGATALKGLLGRAPFGKALGRLTVAEVSETGIEVAQDYFSDIGKSTFQSILLKLHPELNVGQIKSFDKAMQDTWENLPEVAGQMFFLAGLGTGVLTYRDFTDPEKAVYNRDSLRATGLNERAITSLLWETDFEKRDQDFQKAYNARTPEEINNGVIYQQKQAEAIKAQVASGATKPADPAEGETLGTERPRPTLVEVRLADGTRRFNLLDENGNVVREDMSENVAASEYAAYDQMLAMEDQQRRVEEAASDEAVERTAAAEQAWELLSPLERTTTANVLEFSRNERPTPEQQSKLTALQAAVTAEGRPDKVVLVNADVPATRAGLGAANFIRWFETTFGKHVQFVASENGQPLSFGGLVLPSDPNTIFLDAAGNRNVLALLGHEWSHTLEHTNPALWKDVVTNLSPLVVDWAREQGKIVAEGYELSQAPSEFVANVIGDAFADPEFWAMVRQKDFGLFRRMLAAVQEWFDTIMDHVSEWGTNAPDVIKDLQGMRELIAHAIEQAQAGPEVVEEKVPGGFQAAVPRAPSVGSQNFNNWFGKSVVVNPDGSPMVVYHGTMNDFYIFSQTRDLGYHFGTVKAANDRVLGMAGYALKEWAGANIMPVYIRLENPVRLPDLLSWHPATVGKTLKEKGVISGKELLALSDIIEGRDPVIKNRDRAAEEAIISLLESKGYDGVVYLNMGEGKRLPTPAELDQMVKDAEVRELPYTATPKFEARIKAAGWTARGEAYTREEAIQKAREEVADNVMALDDSYIAFHPEQVKSATGNAGTYDRSRPSIQAANRRVEKGFYSKLEGVVVDKIPKSASPEQAKATINGAGIKAEEIKWSGVIPQIDKIAAENQGKVPKGDLVTYLEDEGSVEFKEVEHGYSRANEQRQAIVDQAAQAMFEKREQLRTAMARAGIIGEEYPLTDNLFILDREETRNQIKTAGLESLLADYEDAAKKRVEALHIPREQTADVRYGTYVLPGGENYREVVLAMPEKALPSRQIEIVEGQFSWRALDENGKQLAEVGKGVITDKEGAERYLRDYLKTRKSEAQPGYTSSHFPNVPNYVAHMRIDDREGGTFIEEIQSDRHQQGREKGYVSDTAELWPGWTIEKVHDRHWILRDSEGNPELHHEPDTPVSEQEAKRYFIKYLNQGEGQVPDAPFRKDWPLQMFKRALRDAVSQGKDWIGWTTGETQAERYDLSKQVSVINWGKNQNGNIDLDVRGLDGESITDLSDLSPDKAVDYVGKEIVKKIQESDGKRDTYGTTRGTLSGLDLKVGGEGMKGFYDKMLPSEVQKYVKQWGGKVEQGEVATREPKTGYRIVDRTTFGEGFHVRDEANAIVREFGRRQDAIEFINERGGVGETSIWKVEITPQMKEGVAKGQAQFAAPRREQVAPVAGPATEAATLPVTVFDRDLMEFAPREMVATPELLRKLKADTRLYDQILSCLGK